jgi:hypothetical protein
MTTLPPAPKENHLCWDFYFGLSTGFCVRAGWKKNLKKLKKLDEATIVKAKKPLTWNELDQYKFENAKEASLALMRALALMDTDGSPEALYTAKAFLLTGRAALFLARDAHFRFNLNTPPTGQDELADRVEGLSLAKFIQACIFMASEDRFNISLALSRLAWVVIGQVASDEGENARPAMAEAWLCAAEAEIMLAEIESALGAREVSGVKPYGRLGPWDIESGADVGDDGDDWTVSIPGKPTLENEDPDRTYLANYWWGQTEKRAATVLYGNLMRVVKDLSRYQSLGDDATRRRLWLREIGLEHELYRRGATALANYDAHTASDSPNRELVEHMRFLFPGSPFQPTEEFVRKLRGPPDDESQWNITCLLGALEVKNQTIITVMDTGRGSRWVDMIVGQKLLLGEDKDAYRRPTSRELYDTLLEAIAGSGAEVRATAGPPRSPKEVVVSFRLRDAHPGLSEFLSRVDVECILDSEESLRFACANNHTDFETGGTPEEGLEQTIIGQRVGLCELKRSDLNGRVGRIIRWHEDQDRWEVKLECLFPGENSLKIGVRPTNLAPCPSKFDCVQDYLLYRETVLSWSHDGERERNNDVGPLLDKLRAAGPASVDSVCAICQESAKDSQRSDGLGSSSCLPCGHVFHLGCVLPWIRTEKAECPCCRGKLSFDLG